MTDLLLVKKYNGYSIDQFEAALEEVKAQMGDPNFSRYLTPEKREHIEMEKGYIEHRIDRLQENEVWGYMFLRHML